MTAARALAALCSGLLFGFGLALSGMMNPARVRGFLDVAGAWDPSLAFVLAGAVAAAAAGVFVTRRMPAPVLDPEWHLPGKTAIDRRLVAGSALFGVGWGLAGFCPGPAVAALGSGVPMVAAFVVMMLIGMAVHDRLFARS